jgi:GntR family transcriptional regulator
VVPGDGELWPPSYREIAEELAARVESGEFVRGSVLPSNRELAHEYGVSRGTIARAMKVLQDAGLVVGRQGRGQYVVGRRQRPAETP